MKHALPVELELRVEQDPYGSSQTSWNGEVLLFGVVIYRNGYLVMCDTEEDAVKLLSQTFAHAIGDQIPNDEPGPPLSDM